MSRLRRANQQPMPTVPDELQRSSVPSIHAVGDVSSRLQLTPVALAEATVVVDQLFGDGTRRMDYDLIPTAVRSLVRKSLTATSLCGFLDLRNSAASSARSDLSR